MPHSVHDAWETEAGLESQPCGCRCSVSSEDLCSAEEGMPTVCGSRSPGRGHRPAWEEGLGKGREGVIGQKGKGVPGLLQGHRVEGVLEQARPETAHRGGVSIVLRGEMKKEGHRVESGSCSSLHCLKNSTKK